MIRYKENVFNDYFIDKDTAIITDINGDIIEQKLHCGRPYVMLNGMRVPIHCAQAHTAYGYIKGNDVHHKDKDPKNNALDNLDYAMTHKEHASLTFKENEGVIEIKHHHWTEEERRDISERRKGKDNNWHGRHHTEESKLKMSKTRKGIKFSEEWRKNLSKGQRRRADGCVTTLGMHWWNDGIKNKLSKECPGEGWVKGYIKK